MREGYTFKGNPITLIGKEVGVGDAAPDFTVLDQGLKETRLGDFKGKIKVLSVTPSLDTSVCEMQVRRFNEEAARMGKDVVVLNLSMDLPFAIARFCAAANIERVHALSDHRDASFGNAYGVLIKELRLLARSVILVDKDDKIRYMQIVKELSDAPDFDAALKELGEIK